MKGRLLAFLPAALLVSTIAFAGHPGDDIVAIRFLGTVDCCDYPEAQSVLIGALSDPNERVRFEAVKALTAQLQHGKPALNPTLGFRKFPDPVILSQIVNVARLRKPLSFEEIYERYSEREFAKRQRRERRRRDACCDCCTPEVIAALSRTAYEQDEFGCNVEPSMRVRVAAEEALSLCCQPSAASSMPDWLVRPSSPAAAAPPLAEAPSESDAVTPEATAEPEPQVMMAFDPRTVPSVSRPVEQRVNRLFISGRADIANRFNLFDNMTVEPTTRSWYGVQFAASANPATFISQQNTALFDLLKTANGRVEFITYTGFGRGVEGGNQFVDPNDPNPENQKLLADLYAKENGGRTTDFITRPDTVLHRIGFEYALTPDFSFGMQGQHIAPTEDVGQPEFWGNPQVFMKHALYRSETNAIVGILSLSPQIPKPQYVIGEDTTRINPGLLGFQQLSDRWFSIGAFGFSFPSEGDQLTTFDFALSLSWWLYRDESFEPYYRSDGCERRKFLMGVVPHFEVLGKSVLGNNRLVGNFDLESRAPRTAPGTVSPVDGTTNIYLPQDESLIREAVYFYEEPRHVIDLTASVTFILFKDWYLSSGLSFPVTGGSARTGEFLSTLNYYF